MFACLAALTDSYTTAIIAGISTPMINSTFFPGSSTGERATLQGLLTASILVGGLIGTVMSMPLSNRFGRKISLIVCGSICVVASVGMGLVMNFVAVVVLRTILGLSVGMSATVAPLYNAETVTPEKRGVVGAVFQVSAHATHKRVATRRSCGPLICACCVLRCCSCQSCRPSFLLK